MATYITDEVVFELPDGFVDRSITVVSSAKGAQPLSIVVTRDKREEILEKQVQNQVDAIKTAAPNTKVVGSCSREVGNLPAREVKMTTVAGKQPLYIRQTWVSYYETLLSFSVTSLRAHQAICDSTADRLLDGMKFRKK